MSRKLHKNPDRWSDEDRQYVLDRPWLAERYGVVAKPAHPGVDHSDVPPATTPASAPPQTSSDQVETIEITEEYVRSLNKDDVLELFEDPNLAEDLADVDRTLNKDPLVDAVVAALFPPESEPSGD